MQNENSPFLESVEPNLKTLLFTRNTDKQTIEEFQEHYPARPDGFLPKPFLPINLVATVESFLEEFDYAAPRDGGYIYPERY